MRNRSRTTPSAHIAGRRPCGVAECCENADFNSSYRCNSGPVLNGPEGIDAIKTDHDRCAPFPSTPDHKGKGRWTQGPAARVWVALNRMAA